MIIYVLRSMNYVPMQTSNPRCPMPADREGLDLASKIFILAMKIQDINQEENREVRNRNITVDGGLLV
jgi:hypothetical protein